MHYMTKHNIGKTAQTNKERDELIRDGWPDASATWPEVLRERYWPHQVWLKRKPKGRRAGVTGIARSQHGGAMRRTVIAQPFLLPTGCMQLDFSALGDVVPSSQLDAMRVQLRADLQTAPDDVQAWRQVSLMPAGWSARNARVSRLRPRERSAGDRRFLRRYNKRGTKVWGVLPFDIASDDCGYEAYQP